MAKKAAKEPTYQQAVRVGLLEAHRLLCAALVLTKGEQEATEAERFLISQAIAEAVKSCHEASRLAFKLISTLEFKCSPQP